MDTKRKKLLRSQTKEKSRVLELRQTDCDLQQLTEVRPFCLPIPKYVDQEFLLDDQ